MPKAGQHGTTGDLEIHHPWVSRQHVPIDERTFPPEASDTAELGAHSQIQSDR